jgi:hypothetical protein
MTRINHAAIDQLTEVPKDLFDALMNAGRLARERGQHQLIKNKLGDECLSNSDRTLESARCQSKVQECPTSRAAVFQLQIPGVPALRACGNNFSSTQSLKSEKLTSSFNSTFSVKSEKLNSSLGSNLGNRTRVASANGYRSNDVALAGSAFRAASALRKNRNTSAPYRVKR